MGYIVTIIIMLVVTTFWLMLKLYEIKNELDSKLYEIEDILTKEVKDGETNYLGSELDYKIDEEYFTKFRDEVIGSKKTNYNSSFYCDFPVIVQSSDRRKTIFEEIEALNERFDRLEEYLGIKRLQKEEKVDKYVKAKKTR